MKVLSALSGRHNTNYEVGILPTSFIEIDGVSKQFKSSMGEIQVLRDISLSVDKGEFIAIVGKSGSGKSTLLNVLTGIDYPSSGTVRIDSTDIHKLSESSLAKWRGENIGIVFQFFQLIPTLSVRENIQLAMDFVDSIPKYERYGRAEELLAQVDILRHADKLPQELSGGEQQRAAIARALANDPPILVADEPTGNLDSKTAGAIQRLLANLAKNGKTVIVVTHENISGSEYKRVISLGDGAVERDSQNLHACSYCHDNCSSCG